MANAEKNRLKAEAQLLLEANILHFRGPYHNSRMCLELIERLN